MVKRLPRINNRGSMTFLILQYVKAGAVFASEHVGHRIKPCRTAVYEYCCVHRSDSKDLLRHRRVAKAYNLVTPGEDYLMLSDDCPASYGVDSYFVMLSFLPDAVPVVGVAVAISGGLVYSLRQHDGGSAGSVYLLVVVLFHYFYVKLSS